MSKNEFKLFAQKHPELIEKVNKGETSWQALYEVYDIYGEDLDIWKKYFKESKLEIIDTIKKIDLDELKKGINSIEKILGMLGSISTKEEYKPRPIYKHFDD